MTNIEAILTNYDRIFKGTTMWKEQRSFLKQSLTSFEKEIREEDPMFNLGDNAWLIRNDKLYSFEVREILKDEWLEPSGNSDYSVSRKVRFTYFDYDGKAFDEGRLFKTKDDLLKSLSTKEE